MTKNWALFIGWQDCGDEPPVPLFNIMGGGPLEHSTVSVETLKEQGIKVPPYPSYDEYQNIAFSLGY